jgi:hypothetical protein
MPAIHASLNDDDFVAYHNLAKSKGMNAKELTESIVLAELHKLSNVGKKGDNIVGS